MANLVNELVLTKNVLPFLIASLSSWLNAAPFLWLSHTWRA